MSDKNHSNQKNNIEKAKQKVNQNIDSMLDNKNSNYNRDSVDTIDFIEETLKAQRAAKNISRGFHQSMLLNDNTASDSQLSESNNQFAQNHTKQLGYSGISKRWNKGTIDFENTKHMTSPQDLKAELKEIHIDCSVDQIEKLSDAMLQKAVNNQRKSQQKLGADMNFKTDTKIQSVTTSQKMLEKHLNEMKAFDRMSEEIYKSPEKSQQEKVIENIRKWKGTGYEDDIYKEYQDPMTRKRQQTHQNSNISKKQGKPLFDKSNETQFVTLDGVVGYDRPKSNQINQSKSIHSRPAYDDTKNKIQSYSKFYSLKCEKLFQTQIQNQNEQSKVKLQSTSKKEINFVEERNRGKGREPKIPLLKEWFEGLSVQDRVLSLTTIDPDIVLRLKGMREQLNKVCSVAAGKFRMYSNIPSITTQITVKERNSKPQSNLAQTSKINYIMNLCNSMAYKSDAEVVEAELELLDYVRITDTLTMHDTLTIEPGLVKDPSKFYTLAERIVGKNFLMAPHEIILLPSEGKQQEFLSTAPLWLDMHQPNSLASWILYFVERALCTNFQINVTGGFNETSQNTSYIIGTENKMISLNDELKPFWRTFCLAVQSNEESEEEFIEQLKTKAQEVLKIQPKQQSNKKDTVINQLHGGLEQQDLSKTIQLNQIVDKFITLVKSSIFNFESSRKPQLLLQNMCMDDLKDCASLKQPSDSQLTDEDLMSTRKSGTNQNIIHLDKNINMKLERIFIKVFRDKISSQLKVGMVSKNKKLVKRKIQKMKQRAIEQEKLREAEIDAKQVTDKIKVSNPSAVDILLGKKDEEITPTKEHFTEIKDAKKKKKNKNKKAKADVKEEIKQEVKPEVKIEEKEDKQTELVSSLEMSLPSTPISQQNKIQQNNSRIQMSNKADSQNYFKLMESQQSKEPSINSKLSSELSGALPVYLPVLNSEAFSRGGTTNQTISTSEESKKTQPEIKLFNQLNASSNAEVLGLQKNIRPLKECNAVLYQKQWQRKQTPFNSIINELISAEASASGSLKNQPTEINVKVIKNQLFADQQYVDAEQTYFSVSSSKSSSSPNSENCLLKYSKKKSIVIPYQEESQSDSESSSEDDEEMLLPDVYKIQPADNDSSDYDHGTSEIDEGSSDASSESLNKSKNPTPVKKRGRKNKSKTKSIKSANNAQIEQQPQLINFYPSQEDQINNTIEDEQIINKYIRIKPIPTLTVQYIQMEQTKTTEWNIKQANKKTKKQRKEMYEKFKEEQEEIQPKVIEILKPEQVVIPIEVTSNVQIQEKSKVKKKNNKQDAKNMVTEEMHSTTDTKQEVILPKKVLEKTEKQKVFKAKEQTKLTKASIDSSKKTQRTSKITDQNQSDSKMSMREEAQALNAGLQYQVKKTVQKHVQLEESKRRMQDDIPVAINNSCPQKSDKKSSLNISSKEFSIQTSQSLNELLESQQAPEIIKKKKGSTRSKKRKNKNNQQNNFVVDPVISQQFLLAEQQMQVQNLIAGNQIDNNPQVTQFLQTLNQQVMLQQQAQLEEFQKRQRQDSDNQMIEDCVACIETHPQKYDYFFDQLEVEMENKIKEIKQLKDSVLKEREGFISNIESIVKDTFQNRFGCGFVGIKIFGSMATELAIETSDVDLVVTGISKGQQNMQYNNNKTQVVRMMDILYKKLLCRKDYEEIVTIKFIQTASVPIIKLEVDLQIINQMQVDKKLKEMQEQEDEEEQDENNLISVETKQIDSRVRYLKVDISMDEQNDTVYQKFDNTKSHSGIDTIYHIQDLIKQRKDLRPIVMIIKKIFDETFLSQPYLGGISSYSLVLMVSAYLKSFDQDKQLSLSHNMSGFFHFYGSGFKPHLHYLNGDQIEFCEDQQKRPFPDPFIVLDPMDNRNNISHSTYRIRDIQKALVKAFKIINQSCEIFQSRDLDEGDSNHPKQVLGRLITEIKNEYYSS